MGSFADTLENALLDLVAGGQSVTPDSTTYFAAFTAAPTDAGGGVEIAGGGYARVAVTNNLTNFPAASGGAKSNATAITWPTASGSWGTVVAVAAFSAPSSGTMRYWDDFAGVTIGAGDVLEIPVGDLDLTLD